MPLDTVFPPSRPRLAPSAARVGEAVDKPRPGIPWWLWPHLVGLDAPLVAVVWQWWWARSAQVTLPWSAPCVLGSGVWLIYLVDRLADLRRVVAGDTATPRHAFHARWRVALSILALAVAVSLVLTTPWLLSHAEFLRGLLLLSLAAAYLWLVHGREPRGWMRLLPKEAAVGGTFAAGTAFFPWTHGAMSHAWALLGIGLFGGLCFCNCALITVWEQLAQDVRDHASLLNAFPRFAGQLRVLCLALGCLAGGVVCLTAAVTFLPLVLGGLTLALLDQRRDKIPPDVLRVLADAALLTPLLVGCL